MRANFKNKTTGELFHVTSFKTVIDEKRRCTVNKDALGNLLVDPKTGEELVGIPFDDRTDDDCTTIITKANVPKEMGHTSRAEAIKHFRARADNHTRSDEGKHIRLQSIEREIKSNNKSSGGQQRQD